MTETIKGTDVCAVVTKFDPPSGYDIADFTSRLVKLMMAGARFPGFWSGEMIPPTGAQETEWKLVQRFATVAEASAWKDSEIRRQLLSELSSGSESANIGVKEEITQVGNSEVLTSIVTDVRPGLEDEYFAWEARIQSAQAKFPGYRGLYLQPPTPGRPPQWATLLRFDAPASLESWFACDERKRLLAEAEKFVKTKHIRTVSTSFPGWFPVDEATGNPPPNWKTAMLVLLGLFPVVMLELRYLNPLLSGVTMPLKSFIDMVGSVAATTFVTMPVLISSFKWWLLPGRDHPHTTNARGTALMILLFILEIALFWNP